jgi:hypothetical protein
MLPQLELFPDDCLPSRMGALTVYAGPRLVVDNTPPQRPSTHHSIQLVLDLKSTVPRLVPKTRSVFLGMDSTVFFRNSPPLRRVALRFQRQGVIYLGDFLGLPDPDINGAMKNDQMFSSLKSELARVDLAIGGRFSWWKRPATG